MRHEGNHVKRSHCTVANNGLITNNVNNNRKNVQPQASNTSEKPVVNVQLQRKLDKCFGSFDVVRKYLISKDDASSYNHVHMVGVTPNGHGAGQSSNNRRDRNVAVSLATEQNVAVDRVVPSKDSKSADAISDSVMATRTENPVMQSGSSNVKSQTTIVKKPSEKVKTWNLNTFMECMLSPVADEKHSPTSPKPAEPEPPEKLPSPPSSSSSVKCEELEPAAGSSGHFDNVARSILKKSRLSPLLSPIREFPGVEYKNGLPSLTCRLPLSLVKNVPQLPRRQPNRPPTFANCKENEFEQGIKVPSSSEKIEPTVSDQRQTAINKNDQMPPKHRAKGFDDGLANSSRRKSAKGAANTTDPPPTPVDVNCTVHPESCQPCESSESESRHDLTEIHKDIKVKEEPSTACQTILETISQVSVDKVNATSSGAASGLKIKRKLERDVKSTDSESPKKPKYDNSFLMAAAPEKPLQLDVTVKDYKFYMAKAKEMKHHADKATDKVLRIAIYLESICYFFITGYWMEKTMPRESQVPYNMIKDTRDLLNNVVEKKLPQLLDLNERMQALFSHKLEILALRMQSLLLCHMFSMRHNVAYANYRHITDYHKNTLASKDRPSSVHGCSNASASSSSVNSAPSSCPAVSDHSTLGPQTDDHLPSFAHEPEKRPPKSTPKQSSSATNGGNSGAHLLPSVNNIVVTSSTPSPTPSPASSTGSSSHSLPPGLVAIPQHMEALYKQQLQHLHNLFMAHHHWQVAESKQKQHDLAFFSHLDSICRPLTLTSSVSSVCIYVLTAVHWLRLLYDQQKINTR